MRFRPCIDIHNGKVKQIVGSSLQDDGDRAKENFVADQDASFYAEMFRRDGLSGGHVILLNGTGSPYRRATEEQALSALAAYPGGLQAGGGITAENAEKWIAAGAGQVIVTSAVFRNGTVDYESLHNLKSAVGKEHLVLDISCRKKPGTDTYYIMTDRWQKYTDAAVTEELFSELAESADEFLVHGIAVEGKGGGIDEELAVLLASFAKDGRLPVPVTYAGGIRSEEDIRRLGICGAGLLDFTVGSALDLYGGSLPYDLLAGKYGGK